MVEYLSGNRIQGSSTLTSTPPQTSWKELGRYTLNTTSATIRVGNGTQTGSGTGSGNFTAKDNLRVLISLDTASSTGVRLSIRFNSDGTNTDNYTFRNVNGGNTSAPSFDSAQTSQDFIYVTESDLNEGAFVVLDISNVENKEKYVTGDSVRTASTSSTAPSMYKTYGKWKNTSDQITSITVQDKNGYNMNAGTEVIVLGFDNDEPDSGTNYWTELCNVEEASTASSITSGDFTAPKYIMGSFMCNYSGDSNSIMRFNSNSSGSKYGQKNWYGSGNLSDNASRNDFTFADSSTHDALETFFIIKNQDDQQKLIINANTNNPSTGTGRPNFYDQWGKWIEDDQITNITCSASTGGYTYKNLRLWGGN